MRFKGVSETSPLHLLHKNVIYYACSQVQTKTLKDAWYYIGVPSIMLEVLNLNKIALLLFFLFDFELIIKLLFDLSCLGFNKFVCNKRGY